MFIRKIKNIYHLLEALLAGFFFGRPDSKLKIIGITGTDGKTTTAHLIYHILHSCGKKVSIISSLGAIIEAAKIETGLHTTTPGPFAIASLLKNAARQNSEFFIIETTSHAIDQNRIWGINYYLSLITNVSKEHLDYHGTYLNYLKTKINLLRNSKISLVNLDDESYIFIKKSMKGKKYYTYSLKRKADYEWSKNIQTNLTDFNRQNILAAYAACRILGLSESEIISAIKSFKLPRGRFDLIYDRDFKIFIDFAHTPNAIHNVLSSIKENNINHKKGRIIHVFGSAGLRDLTKRKQMGLASGRLSDIVILTEEDYRTENLMKICEQISAGLLAVGFKNLSPDQVPKEDQRKFFTIIADRFEAIQFALKIAEKGDIVVLTGKGHEKSLARGKKEYAWDEYQAVLKALKS